MPTTSPAESVSFVAAVSQIRTLADGGIRIQLDLPEDATDVAKWLMDARRDDETVRVQITRDA